jgi:transposase
MIFVIRNGLQWKDAPAGYGPHKETPQSLHSLAPDGLFGHIFAKLVGEGPTPGRIMIDATHLKDHRTAASCSKRT